MSDKRDITEMLIRLYGSRDAARRWLESPQKLLDGRVPLMLLREPGGEERVRALLQKALDGVYL
jgi:uncharacterized protein (DUF2384 family)